MWNETLMQGVLKSTVQSVSNLFSMRLLYMSDLERICCSLNLERLTGRFCRFQNGWIRKGFLFLTFEQLVFLFMQNERATFY